MASGNFISPIHQGQADAIDRGVAWLDGGGILGVPTESSYGLVVRAEMPAAVARLRALKGRDGHKPLPLVAHSIEQVRSSTRFDAPMSRLMAALWPGPLTLALTPVHPWPEGIVSPEGTVGVRVSRHPVLQALCAGTGAWLTATSANPAGEPPACRPEAFPPQWHDQVLWLDGGAAPGGLPSTVVVPGKNGTLRVARAGAITLEQLQAVVGAHVIA